MCNYFNLLKVPTIITTFSICWSDVRSYCISRNFYTCGNNEEYDRLCDYVNSFETTDYECFNDFLYRVAVDIAIHSDLVSFARCYNLDDDGVIRAIMYDLTELAHYYRDFF